jgi:putative copper export protein
VTQGLLHLTALRLPAVSGEVTGTLTWPRTSLIRGCPERAATHRPASIRTVLSVDLGVIRLFLHVLAATVWVGGQLVLAALVPVLRRTSADAPRRAARAFNRVAWPSFAVLVATGIWNVLAVGVDGGAYRTTLVVKLAVVAISGLSAYLHARARSTTGLAVFGAVTGLSALGALFLGVLLAE